MPSFTSNVTLRTVVPLLAYALTAALGRLTAPGNGPFALVWPAAGVALVWLLLLPSLRHRLAAAASIAVVWAAVAAPSTLSTGPLLVGALTHGALALATAEVLGRLLDRRPRDGRWLATTGDAVDLVVAALAGTVVTLPTAGIALTWDGGLDPELLWSWVARNSASTVIVGSLLLLVVDGLAHGADPEERARTAVRLEMAAHTVASLALGWVVFGTDAGASLSFGCLAGATWAGYRFSPVTAASMSVVYGTGASLATLAGWGPFHTLETSFEQAVVVQLFAAAGTLLSVLLALSVREHKATALRLVRSEAAARRQTELFEAVAATVNEAILVVDADGQVVMSNPAAQQLVGRGRPLGRIDEVALGFQELDRSSVDLGSSLYARALRGETVHGHPYLHVHAVTGRESVQSVSAAPLAGTAGTGAVVMLSQDVTTQQAQLAELQNFAGMVAHDLKSPLTSVVAWGELLQLEDDPAHVQEGLQRILAAAFRMDRLIDDLLDYSRATARKLGTQELDLDDLVASLAEEIDSEVDRPVTVEHDGLGTVLADPTLTKQTLTNLLRNAAKYVAPDVDPHIRVTAHPRGDMLAITVADNGIGIPADARHRVFESFYRAAHSYPGTGLGLAICKRAVERHGGEILVEDHSTGGTAITFTLPAAMETVAA